MALASILATVVIYLNQKYPEESKLFFDAQDEVTSVWPETANRDIKTYVQPNRPTAIHEPNIVCSNPNEQKNSLLLLIIVTSETENFKLRDNIRTFLWNIKLIRYYKKMFGGDYREMFKKSLENDDDALFYKKFKVVFSLGVPADGLDSVTQMKIDSEAKKYGDILQENFMDTYYNLSIKSTMMLKWVTRKCRDSVRYILKTDDDIHVRPILIVQHITAIAEKFDRSLSNSNRKRKPEYLLIGDLNCYNWAIRNKTSKWYCPKYMYSKSVYPCQITGWGYLFTASTARVLYEAVLKTPIFHLEDIYITGLSRENTSPHQEAIHDELITFATQEYEESFLEN